MRAAARSRLGVMGAGTALAVVGLGAGATAAGAKATSAPPIQRARLVALFPSDRQTVRDASQLTGRRVALPLPNCTRRPTDCNTVRLLDQLDGFDIDPRLALTFDRAVDPAAVAAAMSITATQTAVAAPASASTGSSTTRARTACTPIPRASWHRAAATR